MGTLLLPPAITAVSGHLVFLAGPVQGTADWQTKAIGWFSEHSPSTSLASPRREYLSNEFDYGLQVDWETHFLRRAAEDGVILFWLAHEVTHVIGRSYAQTSRFELAEWKVRHERDGVKLVIGIEEGFSGARYVRRRFGQDCPCVPLKSTLTETCAAAIELMTADARQHSFATK